MKRSSILCILALVSLPACGASTTTQAPQRAPFDGLTVEQEVAIRHAMASADEWHLVVPARVAALCPGSELPALTADSAENMGALRWSLRRVAECYRDGALRGEDIAIRATSSPGHRAVAMTRARAFADVLASFGVKEERIVIKTSEGNGYSPRSCTVELRGTEPRGEEHASH